MRTDYSVAHTNTVCTTYKATYRGLEGCQLSKQAVAKSYLQLPLLQTAEAQIQVDFYHFWLSPHKRSRASSASLQFYNSLAQNAHSVDWHFGMAEARKPSFFCTKTIRVAVFKMAHDSDRKVRWLQWSWYATTREWGGSREKERVPYLSKFTPKASLYTFSFSDSNWIPSSDICWGFLQSVSRRLLVLGCRLSACMHPRPPTVA